jgi:hypothetical protein
MNIKPLVSVISPDRVESRLDLHMSLPDGDPEGSLELPRSHAYLPLINAHDHLIGNWVPRAGDHRPYPNSHVWVEDMRNSFSFRERDMFWINDGSFRLDTPKAMLLAALGCYKSLFSGCGVVHDHAPVQEDVYYQSLPLVVPRAFRQCHSITLGNWWGGGEAEEEMALTKGKMPFIIHLGEGVDDITKGEFDKLLERGLLQPNTLMIHGIAFTPKQIEKVARIGASICWCPTSNFYLIGQTLDIETSLKEGANVCIGTDSTMSGGINLIAEFMKIREVFPAFEARQLYKMTTENAARALMLPSSYARLDPAGTANLLLAEAVENDPFENLLDLDATTIQLLVVDGIPRYGDSEWMETLNLDEDNYTLFRTGNKEKFVLGDPQDLNETIDSALGYHKDFPYLPF